MYNSWEISLVITFYIYSSEFERGKKNFTVIKKIIMIF